MSKREVSFPRARASLPHVLALRAGTDLETLLHKRIFDPLGLTDTSIRVPAADVARLAKGHDQALQATGNWDFSALAGAGAIRSTTDDLLTFLAAAIGLQETPLSKAMASMTAVRRKTDTPGLDIALGWHISDVNGREIVWHNGGTGGYRSFVGFDPKRRAGVVVLSNTFTPSGVDDIGLHLLDDRSTLLAPRKHRKETTLDAKILDRYVGRYSLAPQFALTVTRDGGQLFVQATNQPRFEVFAEGERDFFSKVVDAQLTFETDGEGRAMKVILHQNGRDVPGAHVEGEAAQPKARKVSAEALRKYAGRYQLAPNFVLTVTPEGDRLFVQATGQQKLEVFPKSERDFFYEVVDAQISFVAGEEGKVTSLVLRQNGGDMPAKKIE